MENINDLKSRLGKLILETGALKFGDFTLASGKKSDYYIDGRIVGLMPEGSYLIGKCIVSIVNEEFSGTKAVGGLIAGAVPVAAAAAQASFGTDTPLLAFMVRKETKKHGTQKMVEGPVAPGDNVVVVDDVITTGGSTVEAIERLEEFGCNVLGVISVVDREDAKAEKLQEYKYRPILTISELRAMKNG